MLAKETKDELMKYTKNYDRNVGAKLVIKTNEVQTNSDVNVNITDCTKSLGNELVAVEFLDTTETSSSFDDCRSGVENVDTFGGSEASSDFRGDAVSALDFDGSSERFRMRKKRLTTHWRSFIQPLMWRCKWVELQIRNLQSKSQLYARDLEAYNEKRRTQLDYSTMVDGTKSLPFSQKNAKIDAFRRKKRRRTEATMDIAAYMSHHNLFSCYENRKCFTEGAFMNNELKNPEVAKLKCKLDSIARENSERLSFAGNLDLSPPHSENGMEGTYKRVEDGVLIDNQRVKGEMNSFEDMKIQQMPLVLEDGSGNTTPPVIADSDLLADDQPPAKVRSIAKITGSRSKRKMGRKKSATGRRSRRSTG
ncbi:hypothetical protein C2S51_013609 [Perilla frutescens var. frutescens]|nr:hypothetical protein C2S51_013609 [Perilla frutescens var. frutescens]